MTWKLEETTYKTVKDTKYEVAVLPVGSTEPHNYHIPYGSDTFHSSNIAERICRKSVEMGAKVILLPTIPYGVVTNLMKFPLAINVHQETVNRMIKDIMYSLEQHGILKLVIFNGHGGNDFKPLLREVYGSTKSFVCAIDYWKVGQDVYKDIFENPDDHAGEMETSVGMALFGHLIHFSDAGDGMTKPTRFEAINKGWVMITRPWHLLTESSGAGDPRKASAEKGEKYVDVVVHRISRFIKELSDAKMDDRFPF